MSIPKKDLYHLIDQLPEQQLARAKRYLEMLTLKILPGSAITPRPDNKPCYIDQNCPKCGAALVLADTLEDSQIPGENIWYDEFICPQCRNGIYLDLPESELAEINTAQEDALRGERIDLDEFRKSHGL
jgi:Zn-finger nucleic acid-binding protein